MKTKGLIKATLLCVAVLFSAMSLQSCKGVKELSQADLEGLWILKTLNGKEAPGLFEGALPTLEFDFQDSIVSGSGGCNHYTGSFSYKKGIFNAPNLAVTSMLCAEDNAEPEFIMALSNNNNELTLIDGQLTVSFEGKPSLVFVKEATTAKAATMEVNKTNLAGTWALKIIDGAEAKTQYTTDVPTISFDFENNKVSGYDGCNRFNASFTLNDSELALGSIMSTRMACDNMQAVAKFTQAIADSSNVSLPNENILQIAKNGTVLLEFVKETESK